VWLVGNGLAVSIMAEVISVSSATVTFMPCSMARSYRDFETWPAPKMKRCGSGLIVSMRSGASMGVSKEAPIAVTTLPFWIICCAPFTKEVLRSKSPSSRAFRNLE